MKAIKIDAIIVVILVSALLFTVLFVGFMAKHDCSGEGCLVCAVLNICRSCLFISTTAAAIYKTNGLRCNGASAVNGFNFYCYAPVRSGDRLLN